MSDATAGDIMPAAQHIRRGPIIAICLAVGALVLALLPFNASRSLGRAGTLQFSCRPSIVSAWDHGPNDPLSLWAVTVGTNMEGYEVQGGQGGQGATCGQRGRPRLAVSGVLLVIAGGIAIYDVRARRRRTNVGVT